MKYSAKILLTAALFALGFVFPLAFIGAAIVAFTIYAESRPTLTRKSDGRSPFLQGEEPEWRDRFRECTESPAEEAFLDAMVDAYDLKPAKSSLQGGGLTLRLQVQVLSYRLDFLVDEVLAVEIDGAAWHSSPEAVERDRQRDAALKEAGYTIVRIPAKISLYQPDKAVELVSKMRAEAAAAYADRAEKMAKALKDGFRPKNLIAAADDAFTTIATVAERGAMHAKEARERKRNEEEIIIKESIPHRIRLVEEIYAEFSGEGLVKLDVSEKEARLKAIAAPENRPKTAAAAQSAIRALEEEFNDLRELRDDLENDPKLAEIYRSIDDDLFSWPEIDEEASAKGRRSRK